MAVRLAAALSGGGSKGAFQVGVLDGLRSKGVVIDAFAGVSTGAIQALGGAMDDIDGLLDYWLSIDSNADVYRPSRLNPRGLNHTAPLRRKLDLFFDPAKLRASGKLLRVGVVSLQSGAFRTIDERNPDLPAWIQASCSVPIEFLPIETRSVQGTVTQWVDGGVRNVTPVALARQFDPDGVIVVRASPAPQVPSVSDGFDDLLKIGLRAVDILQAEVSANDLGDIVINNDIVVARRLVAAELRASGLSPADIDRVLAPLDQVRASHHIAPILKIAPDRFFSEVHEFSKANIRIAIEAGRKYVIDEWAAIDSFLQQLPQRGPAA